MTRAISLALLLTLFSVHTQGRVTITENGLQRDGKAYFVKGVGGDQDLPLLARLGCNSVRTWTNEGLDKLLDEAQRNNMTVCADFGSLRIRNGDARTNKHPQKKPRSLPIPIAPPSFQRENVLAPMHSSGDKNKKPLTHGSACVMLRATSTSR